MPRRSLIIGCGGTGIRVAARAVASGEFVTGLVRSETGAERVRAVGAHALIADLDDKPPALPDCDRLFYFAPPPRGVDRDLRLLNVINGLKQIPANVVYISTTGVYGDCGEAWVDEERIVSPATGRAKRRVDAEQHILDWCGHAVVLRAPGIYGPGRLPVARIRDGMPILADASSGWTNRVHIDDLAAIAWQAGRQHWPHAVYNACDGNPTRMSAYYDTLAEMLGLPGPPRVDWATAKNEFSSMRLSFLGESRRLSNARLLRDFDYRFAYADFRDGLTASLRAQPDVVV